MMSRPPWAEAPRRLAGVALHMDHARHHVFGQADAGVAVNDDLGVLVHPGAIVADVPLDLDRDRHLQSTGDGVGALRLDHFPVGRFRLGGQIMESLVEFANRGPRQIDFDPIFVHLETLQL